MVINVRRRPMSKLTRRALAEEWSVLLNGRDVTSGTFYADTRRGLVRRYADYGDLVAAPGGGFRPRSKRSRIFEGGPDEVVSLEHRDRVRIVRRRVV